MINWKEKIHCCVIPAFKKSFSIMLCASSKSSKENPGSATRTISYDAKESFFARSTSERSLRKWFRSTAFFATRFAITIPKREPFFEDAFALSNNFPSLTLRWLRETARKSLANFRRFSEGRAMGHYGVKLFLPFALLLANTFFPPCVLLRFKNPWLLALFFFFGWYVLLIR